MCGDEPEWTPRSGVVVVHIRGRLRLAPQMLRVVEDEWQREGHEADDHAEIHLVAGTTLTKTRDRVRARAVLFGSRAPSRASSCP